MAETAKSPELKLTETENVPSQEGRAGWHKVLEQVDVDVTAPKVVGGGHLKIATRTWAAAVLTCPTAALLLTVAAGFVAAIAAVAHVSGWPVLAIALGTPLIYCGATYLMQVHSRRAK